MRTLLIIYLIASLVTQVAFIWAKMFGTIDWDWRIVLLPIEVNAALFFLFIVLAGWLLREDLPDDY